VKLMDEKGRLFGKVNILDLLVVLLVLAVAGRFVYGRMKAPTQNASQDQRLQVVFKLPGVSKPTVDALPVGTELFDSKSNNRMGKVIEVKAQPAKVLSYTPDGRLVETTSTDVYDVYLTVEGPGRVSDNGVTLNGLEMRIGRANNMKSSLWAGTGITWGITPEQK
jgi:hypothetical protein